MRKFLTAALVAAALPFAAAAFPAAAQVRVTAEQAQAGIERAEAVGQATRRMTEILTGLTGDPRIGSAQDPQMLADAIEARQDEIRGQIEELTAIHRRLTALPPVPGAAGSPTLATMDRAVDDAATMALRSKTILEALLTIPAAVRSGDHAAFQRAYVGMVSSTILFSEFRAAALRGQAASEGVAPATRAQMLAMACFADGEGALQAGIIGLTDPTAAAAKVSAAEACVRDQVAQGRTSLETGRIPDADGERLRQQLVPINAATFDAIDQAAEWLAEGRAAVSRGEDGSAISARLNPPYQRIMARLQELSAQYRRTVAAFNE